MPFSLPTYCAQSKDRALFYCGIAMRLGLGTSLTSLRVASSGGIPAGAVHHYDFSSNANLSLSGSEILSVTDNGSAGTDLSSTATNRPLNTGTINSIQAAAFNDANTEAVFATTGLDSSFNSETGAWTVAVVFSCARTNLNLTLFSAAASGADNDPRFSVNLNTAGTYETYIRDEAANTVPTSRTFGTRDTNAHVMIVRVNASDELSAWLDGTLGLDAASVASAGNRAMDAQIGVGCLMGTSQSLFYEGNIGEVVVYGSALSDGEVSTLNSELASKWGIT